MTQDALNDYLSLPVCPNCDGCGYTVHSGEEVIFSERTRANPSCPALPIFKLSCASSSS